MSKPKINLAPLETVALALVALVAAGVGLLIIGLTRESPAAFMTLGAIVAVGLMFLGGAVVLVVLWFASHMERKRADREQARFVENARENLAIMQATARTQATQNAMLLRQGRELTKALPAPGADLDIDALVVNDAVFSELED